MGKTLKKLDQVELNCRTTTHPVWLSQSDQGLILCVYAQPGAKKDAIVGEFNNQLKIAFTAPPVDGKANAYLIKFLAKRLGKPKSSLQLLSGECARTKRIAVRNTTVTELLAAIDLKPETTPE